MGSRLDGSLHVAGNLTSNSLTVPAGTVLNSHVGAAAAIDETKLEHQHRIGYAMPNVLVVPINTVVYTCHGDMATILEIEAGTQVVCTGNSTITVTVNRHRGATEAAVTAITLDSNNVVFTAEAGSLNSTYKLLVDGDVLEISAAVSPGTGSLGTGLFVSITLAEDSET